MLSHCTTSWLHFVLLSYVIVVYILEYFGSFYLFLISLCGFCFLTFCFKNAYIVFVFLSPYNFYYAK